MLSSNTEPKLNEVNIALTARTRYLSIINDFVIDILDIHSEDALLSYVAQEVVAKMGFADCVIYTLNKDKSVLHQRSASGIKSDIGVKADSGLKVVNIVEIPVNKGISGQAVQRGEPVVVNDVRKEASYIFDLEPALSEVAIPIIYKQEVLGVIDCEDKKLDFFTAEHVNILMTVASIVSAKMVQLTTVSELEHTVSELSHAKEVQSALFDIASLSYQPGNDDKFYKMLHNIINSIVYAENFSIGFYHKHSGLLEFPYYQDKKTPKVTSFNMNSEEIPTTLSGFMLLSEQAVLLDQQDIQRLIKNKEINLQNHNTSQLAHSWLGVPFRVDDDINGIVAIKSYTDKVSYSVADKELLIYASHHISTALNRKLTSIKLQAQILHDHLTNLPNRKLLSERITHAQKQLSRNNNRTNAILYLDLDRFKTINDSLGHHIGDEYLKKVSKFINHCLRGADTLARIGGDEFAILLENIDNEETAIDVAKRIKNHLQNHPILIGRHRLLASASIGITYSHHAKDKPTELLRQADAAMYRSKSLGRANFSLYDQSMRQVQLNIAKLEHELITAIEQDQFVLYFQPIVNLSDEKLTGFEALIRWNHPVKGLVAPDNFIPYAENSGLIFDIDKAMLKKALSQIKHWRQLDLKDDFYISVNISSKHLANSQFVEYLTLQLAHFCIPAKMIAIEITEGALIDDFASAQQQIMAMKEMGIKVMLDDFGTGYSSLGYLHQFPVDTLKIDKSFTDKLLNQPSDSPIISSIIAIAKAFKLKVIGEGIETKEQFQLLKELGCEYGQGYLYSRPLPVITATAYLRSDNRMVVQA